MNRDGPLEVLDLLPVRQLRRVHARVVVVTLGLLAPGVEDGLLVRVDVLARCELVKVDDSVHLADVGVRACAWGCVSVPITIDVALLHPELLHCCAVV